MKIYVVMGTVGEYSDRTDWPVISFKDKETAQSYVIKATQESQVLFIQYNKEYDVDEWTKDDEYETKLTTKFTSKCDPDLSKYWVRGGLPSYFLYEVELYE